MSSLSMIRKLCRTAPFRQSRRVACLSLLLLTPAWAQDPGLVTKMAANEVAARQQVAHFAYTSEERSTRTAGHLWKEKVVETADGPLRRLIAIDNKPLAPDQAQAEQLRIDSLVGNPNDFRKMNLAHKDDEVRATQLLQLLPTAFIMTPDGEADGCVRFTFQPNPSFQPSSYMERASREMSGTVSLKQPENRLCHLDAKTFRPIEFGFGMLGHIDQGSRFNLERKRLDEANWKSDRISVHITGKILLFKTLTQDQEATRTDIRLVPQNLSLQQAAQMTSQ
jgi:hypothetical protein